MLHEVRSHLEKCLAPLCLLHLLGLDMSPTSGDGANKPGFELPSNDACFIEEWLVFL